ncbi:MAG: helix-turn-helix domain-containing protein [Gemmataceae bacterium]
MTTPEHPSNPAGTLTLQQAAALLHLTVKGLRLLITRGEAPKPFKVGRCVRFHAGELHAWIDARCPPMEEWEKRWGMMQTSKR